MKKISLKKVSDLLSDKQMKKVVGGYKLRGCNCPVTGDTLWSSDGCTSDTDCVSAHYRGCWCDK